MFSLLVLEDGELAPAFNRDPPVMKPLCLYCEPAPFRNWIGCSLLALFLLPSCSQHGSGFLHYLPQCLSQCSTLCASICRHVFWTHANAPRHTSKSHHLVSYYAAHTSTLIYTHTAGAFHSVNCKSYKVYPVRHVHNSYCTFVVKGSACLSSLMSQLTLFFHNLARTWNKSQLGKNVEEGVWRDHCRRLITK